MECNPTEVIRKCYFCSCEYKKIAIPIMIEWLHVFKLSDYIKVDRTKWKWEIYQIDVINSVCHLCGFPHPHF